MRFLEKMGGRNIVERESCCNRVMVKINVISEILN